jgi:hypothetical protein
VTWAGCMLLGNERESQGFVEFALQCRGRKHRARIVRSLP